MTTHSSGRPSVRSRAPARVGADTRGHPDETDDHDPSPREKGRCQTTPPAADDHDRPATVAMSAGERAAIRRAGAEDARRSRARQGLPERIEDPAAVAVLAAILRDTSAPPSPSESSSHERKPAA